MKNFSVHNTTNGGKNNYNIVTNITASLLMKEFRILGSGWWTWLQTG